MSSHLIQTRFVIVTATCVILSDGETNVGLHGDSLACLPLLRVITLDVERWTLLLLTQQKNFILVIPTNTGIDEMFMKSNCLICDGIDSAVTCVGNVTENTGKDVMVIRQNHYSYTTQMGNNNVCVIVQYWGSIYIKPLPV